MKTYLSILLILVTGILNAQQIRGIVRDEAGKYLPSAAVSLIKLNDTSFKRQTLTKTDGSFLFEGVKSGNYRINISHIGFKQILSPVFVVTTSDVTVSDIQLGKVSNTLTSVTVTASKPLMEVKADKTILNVEGTINAIGSNALELLRKSPGVLLDQDDNISLAGKNGVQVYIDGRTTPLSGQELANYLKSLQSTQIEAIELITNPSARYDAAGNAGIINIRLKKNKSFGFNGSINAGWNLGITPKYNGGASLNYRNKSINIFSNISFNNSPNEQRITTVRSFVDSLFVQNSVMRQAGSSFNFKVGIDYFIDKTSTIGIMVNGTLADPRVQSESKTNISGALNARIDRILSAGSTNQMNRENVNVNLNYTYINPKGTSLSVNADRGTYDLNSDQWQPNYYFDASGQVALNTLVYHMVSPSKITINSFKIDYEQDLARGKLSLGAKSAWVKTDNDFQRFNVNSNVESLDKDRSNHFLYTENINAGYVNYNRQFKGFMVQTGIRIENTVSEGSSDGFKWYSGTYVPSITSFKKTYTNFFPSAAITFNKNPMKQWSLTYSRRIDRPAYQDLNPFEYKMDEYTFMKGNINLRPQYTNSFGIAHTYKYKLNIALNYSHVKDLFTQIIDTAEKSKAFISKKNLATQDIASLTISYPFQYKSYSLFANISTNYSKYKADFGTGRKVDLDAFGFSLFAQNSLKFAKVWVVELSGFYNSPTIYQGSFQGKSIYSIDAGISKQILKGKATVKASVSDVFHTIKFRAKSDFAGQVVKVDFQGETRLFKLSCNIRFGNSGVKAPKARTSGAEDELKRVQQSSGVTIGNN